ncbi:MAG: choice-of-anchor L domain-containing protein [Saprospiraceae bacterium]|nr:choice-of-anchor L domain-containing protein [Saprospiraceae bacterium]
MAWSWRLSVLGVYLSLAGIAVGVYAPADLSPASPPPPNGVISTSGQYTVEQLVRNIFVRDGCDNISNIRAIGPAAGIGFFENGLASIGVDRGIILATGPISNASGPNNFTDKSGSYNYSGGDPDLDILSGATVRDRIGLEFDFVPLDSFVTFRYVFASEEYCEFVGSVYNDVFGFFISGPGISGPFSNNSRNIALIPGSNSFVSINSVNHLQNEGYFVRNDLPADALQCNMPPHTSPYLPYIQYDGFTRQLTASLKLIPCETYHLRLVVADVGDNFYDSAVFLEAESFNIGGAVTVSGHAAGGGAPIAKEGCGDGYFQFRRVDTENRNTPITVRYVVSTALSTAVEGEDFAPLPGIVTIPAGQTSVNVPVNAINDQIPEPIERLVIELDIPCACYTDTALLYIMDSPPVFVHLPDAGVCNDEPAQLQAAASGGTPGFTYRWSTGATGPGLTVTPASPTYYSVTVYDACGNSAADTAFVDITTPPEAFLSGDAEICEGDSAFLQVVFSGTPPWEIILSVDDEWQPPITGITANPYPLPATLGGHYRIERLRDAYCNGPGFGEGHVNLLRIQADVQTVPVSCFGFSDGSISAAISQGLPPYQFFWSHGIGSTLNPQNLPAGIYYLDITDAQGCRKVVPIEVEEPQPLSDVVFSCEDLSTPGFAFSATGGRPPYIYDADGSGFSDFTIFNRLQPGERYQLRIRDASGCLYEQDWLMPALYRNMVELPATLRLRLGEDAELNPMLHIPQSLIAAVRWVPAEGLSCVDCLNPTLTALNSMTYTIRIIDVFGCTGEASVEVIVDPAADIFVPNAFSPNGDGNNDRLIVFANMLQVREIVSFQVFDRWGAQLFKATDIPPNEDAFGWDGTAKGRPLDPGVYVYVVQVELANGQLYSVSGEAVLLR